MTEEENTLMQAEHQQELENQWIQEILNNDPDFIAWLKALEKQNEYT